MNIRRTVSLGLGIVAATCFSTLPAHSQATHNSHCLEVIDLAGQWQFAFDSAQYSRNVTLPGTTDTNGLGEPCADKTETTRLSRRFSYKGQAWYRTTFDIPEEVPAFRHPRGSSRVDAPARTQQADPRLCRWTVCRDFEQHLHAPALRLERACQGAPRARRHGR